MKIETILRGVTLERQYQDEKWGKSSHALTTWLALAIEESGELAQAIVQMKPKHEIAKEAIQVMAVLAAMLEDMDTPAPADDATSGDTDSIGD